ncbi:MAG: alpha/beta hydrolase [Oscillospiraceae bacterium]|nr:alpha/beta hydrolase [Oscillospiraceae bacterium]
MYWVTNATAFFQNYVGNGAQSAVKILISYYRFFHPDDTLELAFMPASVQEMLRGLDMYDPAFGAAFYEGTWNQNFNHAEALQKIQCPVLLIQADTSFMEDGTLNGAMSEEMAERALSCLSDGTYIRVNAGHVTNLEIPDEFTKIITDFLLDKNKNPIN